MPTSRHGSLTPLEKSIIPIDILSSIDSYSSEKELHFRKAQFILCRTKTIYFFNQ